MRWIVAVDDFVQRYFDRVIHWVMRTCSVTKGFIRRVMWQCQIAISLMLVVICAWPPCEILATIVNALLVLCHILSLQRWSIGDARAEKLGLFNADDWTPVLHMKVVNVVALLIVEFEVGIAASFRMYCQSTCLLLWLFHYYLMGTFPVPPAKKQAKQKASLLRTSLASGDT